MKIEKLNLFGTLLIIGGVNQDERGNLFKPFSKNELAKYEIDMDIKEVLHSTSRMNVIRGMHFQLPPYEQAKLVSVVKGKITDVLLDIRTNSESYGKFVSVELSGNDGISLYIPKGIAHGFVSRAEESTVLYMVNGPYSPENESGVRYDSFGFEWEVDKPIISSRDLAFPDLFQFRSQFRV